MASKIDTPTREEKEEQLQRILASDTFKTRWALRELLERVVMDGLNGKIGRSYERTLAIEVFKKEQGWRPLHGAVVRQGMTNLRKHLAAYYKANDDKVDINFPKQAGFVAHFSYRWRTASKEAVHRLADAFSESFPDLEHCDLIVSELQKCVAQQPSYAPAYTVLAESLLAGIYCGDYLDEAEGGPSRPWAFAMPTALKRAEEVVKLGLKLDAQSPRLHVMAGAIHCCRFAWKQADAAFETAMRLAPTETRSSFWYAVFLFAVGRTEEGIYSASFIARYSPGRLGRYIRPFLDYVVFREFDIAFNDMIAQAHSIFSYSDWSIFQREPSRFDDWPAGLLMACICLALDYHYVGARYASDGIHRSRVDAFLGLELLLLGQLPQRTSRANLMTRLYNQFDQSVRQGPVSCAMAYLSSKKTEEAVKQLELACEFGHPAMIWLHLWPIFDPLRENDRFKALIKKMNLP